MNKFYKLLLEQEKKLFIQKPTKVKYTSSQIRDLVKTNIVEVKFKRRIYPVKNATYQRSPLRRMLATSNWKFLNKYASTFKFKPPKGTGTRDANWYVERGLIIVYDLITQSWRMISLDKYDVVNIYPIKTDEEQSKYIPYYLNLLKREGRLKLHNKFNEEILKYSSEFLK